MARQKYGRWYTIVDLLLRHENPNLGPMSNSTCESSGHSVTTYVLDISTCHTVELTDDILADIIRVVKLFATKSVKHRKSLKYAAREMIYEVCLLSCQNYFLIIIIGCGGTCCIFG